MIWQGSIFGTLSFTLVDWMVSTYTHIYLSALCSSIMDFRRFYRKDVGKCLNRFALHTRVRVRWHPSEYSNTWNKCSKSKAHDKEKRNMYGLTIANARAHTHTHVIPISIGFASSFKEENRVKTSHGVKENVRYIWQVNEWANKRNERKG